MHGLPHDHHHHTYADQRERMLEEPVAPLICTLAVPCIISMLVTSIYNMADTYFVSQLSTSASGAVGIVFSIMAIIQAFGFMIGVGSGSMASRLMGQNKQEQANVVASSAVCFALVLGLLLAGTGLLRLPQLIWLLGSTDTIYPYAVDYARFILMGAPVMMLAFTLNNLLRWQGQASLSVIGLATGGILNIVLDPIFIFVFDMGIAGAGAATLLSQCVSMSILASMFLFKRSTLRLSLSCVSRSPGIYLAITKQGLPSLARQGINSVATMAINYNARLYGDAAVAALAIVTKVFMTIQSVTVGFGQGFQPVLGYAHGAGRMDRVKQAIFFSLKLCSVVLSVLAVLGFLFAPQIIHFFRDDPLVIDIGIRAFRYQCLTMPFGAIMVFANMLFQSIGRPYRATFLALSRQGLTIPMVFLLSSTFGRAGLEATQGAVDAISILVCGAFMLHFFTREFQESAPQER